MASMTVTTTTPPTKTMAAEMATGRQLQCRRPDEPDDRVRPAEEPAATVGGAFRLEATRRRPWAVPVGTAGERWVECRVSPTGSLSPRRRMSPLGTGSLTTVRTISWVRSMERPTIAVAVVATAAPTATPTIVPF